VNLDALNSGSKWGGSVVSSGSSASLSYSFPWANGAAATFAGYNGAAYSLNGEQTASSHFGLNNLQQNAASAALQTWANVANTTFTQVSDTSTNVGDIRFAFTSAKSVQGSWAYASFPNAAWPAGGDVWINSQYGSDTNWAVGSTNFFSLIHEIGHAIGLKHDFEGSVTLPASLDNRSQTVMSYTDAPNSSFITLSTNAYGTMSYRVQYIVPETPMLLDIAAVQYMYGANYAFNADDTTYTFDPAEPFLKTIWDGGGKDTISVPNFTRDCLIDLNAGHFSNIATVLSDSTAGYNWVTPPPTPTYDAKANLCIAYNCTIENAVGGSGNDTLIGNSSNNNFKGGTGNDSIDGSDGIDTASYSGVRAAYKLIKSATSLQVSSTLEGNDTLANIERLQFTNVVIALDINANAGQAYRIYQAAFNRTPDNAGLKYWIGIMDSGVSLSTVSSAFIASAEFQKLYGPNPSNAQFVTKLYDNVLHRAPDTGGYNYWVGLLNSGGIDKISTLVNFSESNENQAGVIGVIQNGIELFN
jgi:hypothetical protein